MLDLFVPVIGGLLGALALPNEVVPEGWSFLGFVFLLPLLWFTKKHGPGASALAGALWIGALTLTSQGWLGAFHPVALGLVLAFQLPLYGLVAAASSWTWRWAGSAAVWAQAALWTVWEWLRLQGFLGFPYGSVASTVWTWPVLWQSAAWVGTAGITFLLAWTSASLAELALEPRRVRTHLVSLGLGLGLWAVNLAVGVWGLAQPLGGPTLQVALVQPAINPWQDWAKASGTALTRLTDLTKGALGAEPRPDLVVWSETAVVPSVEYHLRYRENPESLRVVRHLEAFLDSAQTPVLLGNGHRERGPDGTLKNYNAVLAWDGGWQGRYEKSRLVPFTESFPFGDLLPGVRDWLVDHDTHFWEVGRQTGPLTVAGLRVGTPICFEDAFPERAAALARDGARLLVNLTDDAWSPGTASRRQHLALAVFRTVETGLPLVRSANDGATVVVDARGRVTHQLPIGAPGVLVAPVVLAGGGGTWYARFGDLLPPSLGILWITAALSLTRDANCRKITQGARRVTER